jgi:hypothetical protein
MGAWSCGRCPGQCGHSLGPLPRSHSVDLTMANVLQRGLILPSQDSTAPSAGVLTEWPANPWLCVRTTPQEKGPIPHPPWKQGTGTPQYFL